MLLNIDDTSKAEKHFGDKVEAPSGDDTRSGETRAWENQTPMRRIFVYMCLC